MLGVYKPHTNRDAVGVWLCFAAKRPSKRSALVIYSITKIFLNVCPESIEQLVRAKDLKFGWGVGNTLFRNKF